MAVGVILRNRLTACPTPILLTSVASHLVAALFFFRGSCAAGTFGHCMKCTIKCECRFTFAKFAFSDVPWLFTLKTYLLSTLADGPISAFTKSWLLHSFATVRFGTPLQVLVSTYLDVLLDCVEELRDLFGAKALDLFSAEDFFALELHAW